MNLAQGSAVEPFAEQAEVTNRVNYNGTKNVSNALLPLLRPHARVVNVSSLMGKKMSFKSILIKDSS
jgi:carbonyl reductase 1